MEPYSTLEPTSPGTGTEPIVAGVGSKSAELHPEQAVQQNGSTRSPQSSASAALGAARAEAGATLHSSNPPSSKLPPGNLTSSVRFPGEDGGHSLAEITQRDLDAALQLLTDRAQYITGASGAAIALRRNGRNDMLCRASTGSNAPELGALLSTEFGLSGESVRTRQALRCDDAERDARVNREVCRQMGIASVVVMPVVKDDEVLGVFELFSGKTNAFGARDVSAVERLSEMVETAVRLAQATENLPERLKMQETSAPEGEEAEILEDQVLEVQALAGQALEDLVLEEPVLEEPVLDEQEPVLEVAAEEGAEKPGSLGAEALPEQESSIAALEALRHPKADVSGSRKAAAPELLNATIPIPSTSSGQALSQKVREDGAAIGEGTVAAAPEPAEAIVPENAAAAPQAVAPRAEAVPVPSSEPAPAKKKLFWSAALSPVADVGKPEEADQSHVPPVLRSLRKCDACGFPVSAGRVLCVECEEKKWRGQLRVPKATPRQAAVSGPAAERPVTSRAEAITENRGPIASPEVLRHPKAGVSVNGPGAPVVPAGAVAAAAKPEARAFAAAAQSTAGSPPMPATQRASATVAVSGGAVAASPAGKESKEGAGQPMAAAPVLNAPARETAAEPAASQVPSPEFVLSAGLEPSQSWLSANKYIIGVLLVVAAVVVAVFLLR